ncbi:MAG: energy-coupling factor transporter transmembrane component T [Raoultibacter sp.]|jgi:energy-coupling factor transporter transmembrane protein EcfT
MFAASDQASQLGSAKLDPRTKLLLLMTVSLVIITGGTGEIMQVLKLALMFVPPLLCIWERRFKGAFIYVTVLVAFILLSNFVMPYVGGAPNLLLSMVYVIVSRFMPCVMMGWYFITTTNVSEFVSAMERMHVPRYIVTPLSVMFRFAPTVAEEFGSINDAMTMRGIRFSGGRVAAMFEYRVIPMIMCSLRIGEELSASALTRGLGSPSPRTSIAKIGFKLVDYVVMAACFGALSIFILNLVGVL